MEAKSSKIFNNVVAAAIIAIGFTLLGLTLRSGIKSFKDSERVVAVKGLSEREVMADRVIWPLTYKEVGDNLLQLYNTIESTNKKIVNFLTSNGLSIEDITVNPAQVVDLQAERYGVQNYRYRYNVTSVITVSTSKVDLVRTLMSRQGDLLKEGIAIGGNDYQNMTQFSYSGLNSIKPDMIEDATKNARASAEKFAVDSQSKLGKIKFANQGQFSITDRDANTPYVKIVRVVTTTEYYLKD